MLSARLKYKIQLCGAMESYIFRCVTSVAHLFIFGGHKMKLMIAGSRSITEFDLAPYIPDGVDTIISGGAKGIDSLAEKYADEHKIPKIIITPRYELYGKAATIKRNYEMVDMSDCVLVVWDGRSRGTKSTIEYANKKGKPLIWIKFLKPS